MPEQETVNPRTAQHTSQRRLSVNSSPDAINLTPNGEPTLIHRSDGGLYWVVKHNGVIHNLKFQPGPIRDRNDYVERSLQIDRDLLVKGEIKGSRAVFNFGEATGSSSATWYMDTVNGVAMSTTRGYVMHRPGSVVGASVQCNCTSDAGTAVMRIHILINGTLSISTATNNVTATGVWSNYEKFDRHIYPFAAGQFLSVAMVRTGDASTNDDAVGYFEVVFDS